MCLLLLNSVLLSIRLQYIWVYNRNPSPTTSHSNYLFSYFKVPLRALYSSAITAIALLSFLLHSFDAPDATLKLLSVPISRPHFTLGYMVILLYTVLGISLNLKNMSIPFIISMNMNPSKGKNCTTDFQYFLHIYAHTHWLLN